MKFVTNSIRTGKAKTFQDLVQDFQNSKESSVKTASVDETVKTARTDAKQDEGESSGQLDVEPLHQEGESTPKVQGKTPAQAGSKEASTKEASGVQDTDNENNGPADDSEQPGWEGKQENNNDPEAGRHRDGDGDQDKSAEGEVESKEASVDKQACDCGKDDCEECCDDVEASAEGETKEAATEKEANLDNIPEDKRAKPFGASDDSDDDSDEVEAEAASDSEDKEEKKSSAAPKFQKVANLDGKSKSWLKEYWADIYMPEYADAMTADK